MRSKRQALVKTLVLKGMSDAVTHIRAQMGLITEVVPLSLYRLGKQLAQEAGRRYGKDWAQRQDIVEMVHLVFALHLRRRGIPTTACSTQAGNVNLYLGAWSINIDQEGVCFSALGPRRLHRLFETKILDPIDPLSLREWAKKQGPDWDGCEMLNQHITDTLGLHKDLIRTPFKQAKGSDRHILARS